MQNDETSDERFHELLLRVIAEDNYIPKDCQEPEHDETEIASTLTGENRICYEDANNGDDVSQLYIANSFLKGRDGFPVDKAIGFKYMKKAASKGNKSAIYGLSYLMKPDFRNIEAEGVDNFHKMLKIATYFDSDYASYTLGFMYLIGYHVRNNTLISIIYFKFSADMNYAPAMMLFADHLRRFWNNRMPKNDIERLKIECIDFLNDDTGINRINGKLKETAESIFIIIEDPQLIKETICDYYMKVIEDGNTPEERKNKAYTKLENFM